MAAPSDMEQTLDEILSGVQSLLEHAPSAPLARADRPSRFDRHTQDAGLTMSSDDASGLLAALIWMQSDSGNPMSQQAGRWITQILSMRATPLGSDTSAEHAQVRVSPLLAPRLSNLAEQGAVLAECDASSMYWDVTNVDLALARQAMGRFQVTVCPEQKEEKIYWRIPRLPERLPLRWIGQSEFSQHARYASAKSFAVIDQDKTNDKLATLLWIADLNFVPDWWCAMTVRDGQWLPVVMMH